mmetsp:Transcript_25062/g.63231  ORF Transcript_25062/g.63231 Transcript_25062/m.63231 type:complete len:239 (-) Transcript_25062:80-796(-)
MSNDTTVSSRQLAKKSEYSPANSLSILLEYFTTPSSFRLGSSWKVNSALTCLFSRMHAPSLPRSPSSCVSASAVVMKMPSLLASILGELGVRYMVSLDRVMSMCPPAAKPKGRAIRMICRSSLLTAASVMRPAAGPAHPASSATSSAIAASWEPLVGAMAPGGSKGERSPVRWWGGGGLKRALRVPSARRLTIRWRGLAAVAGAVTNARASAPCAAQRRGSVERGGKRAPGARGALTL